VFGDLFIVKPEMGQKLDYYGQDSESGPMNSHTGEKEYTNLTWGA
jgi:hypothetical protein